MRKHTTIKTLTVSKAMEKEERFFKDWIEAYRNYLHETNPSLKDDCTIIGVSIYGSPKSGYYEQKKLTQGEVLQWVKKQLIGFSDIKIFVKSGKYLGIIYPKECSTVLLAFLRFHNIDWQYDAITNRCIDFEKTVVKYQPNFFKK